MQDKNQGFPPALTNENLAAALKRAADAEDHLRREIASNQALIARQTEMERQFSIYRTKAWDARKESDSSEERLRMSRRSMANNLKKHCEVSTTEIAERDATISGLREQLQAHDQTIADLQDKIETALLSEWRGGPDADVRVESDHIIIAFPTPNGEWAHAYKHTVSEALTLRRRLETALSTVPGTEMGEGIWEG